MKKNQKLLLKALNENKLFEFIAGLENFQIENEYADTPTNTMEVIYLIKGYYNITEDFTIWKDFNKAIGKLIKDETLVWFSLYYLYDLLRLSDREGWIQEYIDLEDLIKSIELSLVQFKNSLGTNKSWVGREYENGLWEDVLRLKNNIFDSYGVDLNLVGNNDLQ